MGDLRMIIWLIFSTLVKIIVILSDIQIPIKEMQLDSLLQLQIHKIRSNSGCWGFTVVAEKQSLFCHLFTAGLLTTLLQAVFVAIFIHKDAKSVEQPNSNLQCDSLHYCLSCNRFD